MDYQLKQQYGENFTNLFLYDLNQFDEFYTWTIYELEQKYQELIDYGEKYVSKDKVRKWFVDNMTTIEEYYESIIKPVKIPEYCKSYDDLK